MAAKYIKPTSPLSPKNVWDKLNSGDWSFDDCPWVIKGNLCVSVTFTGDGSWREIVRDLYGKGQQTFTVLAGRHGDQLGQEVDTRTGRIHPRNPNRPADTAINPEDDRTIARQLNGSQALPGIHVVVQDVGDGSFDTVGKLTTEIRRHLSENRIVILAWCYSLFAMKPGWDQNVKNTWPQVFLGPNMTPIAWTARDWDWVSTYGLLPAAVAAEHEAAA